MGAREELLAAARQLARDGKSPFSPAELIAQARSTGCNYPDTTLRTHIVGPMCLNSPDNHPVQYGDLVRVARARYRLVGPADSVSDPTPEPPPSSPTTSQPLEDRADATHEWFWEGNVQAAVVSHLTAIGWSIRRVADTASRERGVDIEAVCDGERVLVEVKGYPSSVYVRGPKAGQPKSNQALQARHSFADALLSGLLMRADNPDASVVLAFPAVETYMTLTDRLAETMAEPEISIWLVEESGEVREASQEPQGL